MASKVFDIYGSRMPGKLFFYAIYYIPPLIYYKLPSVVLEGENWDINIGWKTLTDNSKPFFYPYPKGCWVTKEMKSDAYKKEELKTIEIYKSYAVRGRKGKNGILLETDIDKIFINIKRDGVKVIGDYKLSDKDRKEFVLYNKGKIYEPKNNIYIQN